MHKKKQEKEKEKAQSTKTTTTAKNTTTKNNTLLKPIAYNLNQIIILKIILMSFSKVYQ